MSYEYKVVPAPTRGLKAKGVKTAEERFANALQTGMNNLAAEGWEYMRTDTLPSEQREGIMGKTTIYQNMLVFRRPKTVTAALPAPTKRHVEAPAVMAPTPPAAPKPAPTPERPSPDVAAE